MDRVLIPLEFLATPSISASALARERLRYFLQNSAFQPSRGRLLYIHPVGWLVGWLSRFVTINSTSNKTFNLGQKPNLLYIWGKFMMLTAS